jgi:hypothetical protein
MMEQGLSRGGLKRATEAWLHLGVAQLLAGQREVAKSTLRSTLEQAQTLRDPLVDAVRLWHLWATAAAGATAP